MAKKRSYKRRRRTRRTGLAGLTISRLNAKAATTELLDVVCIAGGAFAAAKGIGILDKVVNKGGTNKMMGYIAPAVVSIAGVAGAMIGNGILKSLAKGVAMGGVLKVAEKALNKENLLSGVDDQPLMLPGIGSFGMAELPELSHYSENSDADVTTTGNDPQYYMGTPSEVLSGDDEIEAY